jgi:tRNA(Ile)-lysidine synthetase, N-terminal domain
MSINEAKFFSYLNSYNCFEKYPSVAVGVSGGPDSIALVYLLNKWIKLKKGKLYALIFNHRIRNNSTQEAKQVKDILKDLKINSIILRANKNNLIKKNMSQARSNRFDSLINFCINKKIIHLFLGHHFDDNLETYLIRKINGSNFEGLSSMDEISYFDKIQIIRPFLKIKKSSILRFNNKKKLIFLKDPTNNDINYTRVKVRNFLQNNNYKKLVKCDFFNIKKEINAYKLMVWSYFLDSLRDIKSKNIKIDRKKLLKYHVLIIEKIILICLKFFSKKFK